MPEVAQKRATINDLYNIEGPAELINGRIVPDMTGERPGEVALKIVFSLWSHAKRLGRGKALGDGVGYLVPVLASGRESFAPDASYHTRPPAANPMRFVEGPPDFAVEVRSENDYGPAAEQKLADKRADYFQAGTQVVWDVDPEAETVQVYRAVDPAKPNLFRRGQTADAEPAVPGWRISVDEVFE